MTDLLKNITRLAVHIAAEIMTWREQERKEIKVVHMDNLVSLLVITKIDKILNEVVRELYGMDERIDESVSCGLGTLKI